MNERTFGQPSQQLPSRDKGLEQQERRAIRVEDWARENNHEALMRYIKSSEQTNSNVGLLPENMYYDPEKKTMTLTVPYHKEWHQGHEGVMQGGVPAVFIDTTSGALAFTEMPSGSGPLHQEDRAIKLVPIVEHEVPVVITCSLEEPPEDFKGNRVKTKFIKTVVSQGPHICIESYVMVRSTLEQAIDQDVANKKASLDVWLAQQNT
jgi:acyl-coenzyme A thioesterase PaaI-like protein